MKKLFIILGVIFVIIIGCVIFVFESLKPVSKSEEFVVFTIQPGQNKVDIVTNLKAQGLIRNKYVALLYVFINPGTNLQAGTYELSKSYSTQEIVSKINNGEIIEVVPTVQVKFIEGKTLEDYSKLLEKNFTVTSEEVLSKAKDKEYLKTLINKYWFIDESILNDELYYGLEGYLSPNTYEFYKNASVEDIFTKLLDQTEKVLNKYKDEITASPYSVHEILALASVVEKEGTNKEDREKIAQVLLLRLNYNMSLGCDVTTYYAVHKSLKEGLTLEDLATPSPYNTRAAGMEGKIPVGPICMPSEESIAAVLHPSNTQYLYFLADVETGEVYFFESYDEFAASKTEIIK